MSMNYGGCIEELLSPLKQRMEMLEEENRQIKGQLAQLRQENTDLRRGIGITVLIDGKAVPTGSGPLPDLGSSPVAAMHAMQSSNMPPRMSPTAQPAFATAPAGMSERTPTNHPQASGAANPGATAPNNLFPQNPLSRPQAPAIPVAPQGAPNRDGQPNSRGAGYRDFFLD